jgi:hypothetical protein
VKAKPILQGAGIAVLYTAPFAAGFLTPTLGDAYHRIHPLTTIYRAILVAILLIWLLGTLGFLLLERLPERWRRALWLIPLILLPWLFFRGITGASADSPNLAVQALHVGHFLWKHSADWSTEGSRASRDGYDPRPVLIVSLPEGSGHEIAQPASALVVHGILQSLLRSQMRTTVDVDELVEKQSQETDDAQPGS